MDTKSASQQRSLTTADPGASISSHAGLTESTFPSTSHSAIATGAFSNNGMNSAAGLAGICRTSAVALIYFTLREVLQERSARLQPPILQFSQNGKSALCFVASDFRFRAHYKQNGLPLRRADVTKNGRLAVENSVSHCQRLACTGCKIIETGSVRRNVRRLPRSSRIVDA